MKGSRVAVTDASAVALLTLEDKPLRAKIANRGSNDVNLGDSDVSSSTGYTLPAGAETEFHSSTPQTLYGICAALGSSTIHVLTY